jgi:archaellum biogenesis protein FlaJ (TadC family)
VGTKDLLEELIATETMSLDLRGDNLVERRTIIFNEENRIASKNDTSRMMIRSLGCQDNLSSSCLNKCLKTIMSEWRLGNLRNI